MRTWKGWWLVALLAGAVRAQDLPSKMEVRDVSYPVRTLDLPSGMRIVLEQDRSRPLVAVVSVVDVGGAQDPQGKEGLAHVVEHLGFRSVQDKRYPLTDLLEVAGAGRWNAFTSWDQTVYYEVGGKQSLTELLALEGARLLQPLLGVTKEVFDTEMQVVRNELLERDEQGVFTAVSTKLNGALFPAGHPYARSVIGSETSLANLKLEDAEAFVKQYYRPERMTLVISGDFDPAAIGKVLDAAFPTEFLEPGPSGPVAVRSRLPSPVPTPPPPLGKDDLIRVRAPSEVPLIFIGWAVPSGYDKEGYLAWFVTQMAGGASAGAGAHDDDLYGIGATLVRGKEASMIVVIGRLGKGVDPARSASLMMDELVQTWAPAGRAGTSAENVKRQEAFFLQRQNRAFVDLASELEDIGERAVLRAQLVHTTADVTTLTREMRSIGHLDAAEVARYAHAYLARDRARVVYLEPDTRSVGEDESAAVFASSRGIKINVDPATLRARVASPGASLRSLRLQSGLEVVLARRPTAPIVAATLTTRGGRSDGEPFGGPEFADFGAPTDRKHGIAANYGIAVGGFSGRGSASVTYRAANGNLDNALAMLLDRVQSYHVDAAAQRFIDYQYRHTYRLNWETPSATGRRTLWGAVFGSHPLGRALPPERYEKLDVGDGNAWIERAYVPTNGVLSVVGDFELDKGERAVRSWFESWTRRSERKAFAEGSLPSRGPQEVVPIVKTARPGARQLELELGCAVPLTSAMDRVHAGLLLSRMQTRLQRFARLSIGSSYGFSTAVTPQPSVLQLSIRGKVDERGATRVLALIRSEADGLGKAVPDALDFARAQWDLGIRQGTSYEDSASLALELSRIRLAGLPAETLERFPEDLVKATPEGVQQVGAECRKRAVILLVGDRALMDRLVPAS
jgi:zinc protease